MDGFKVVYRNSNGSLEETWFGSPVSSFDVPAFVAPDIVRMMFFQSHPGCQIVSFSSCSLESFSGK